MALYLHIESAADPGFYEVRVSANPGPERKPPMIVAHSDLNSVLAMFLKSVGMIRDEAQ